MKKFFKGVLVAAILALSPLLVGAPVSAQQATCEIGFTGPNSQNECTSTTSYECTVENTNVITITGSNEQDAISGVTLVSGNTSGGSATSGTVSNSNGVVYNVTIDNSGEGQNGTCVATRTVPATTPPAPVVPVNTGGGEVAALPVTSGSNAVATVGIVAGALAVLAALSVAGAYVYRRLKA